MTNPLKKKRLIRPNIIAILSIMMVVITISFWENQAVIFGFGCVYIVSFLILSIQHNLKHCNKIICNIKVKGEDVLGNDEKFTYEGKLLS